MAFEDINLSQVHISGEEHFDVIDKNDDPMLWPHTKGLDAWDKYKSVPGGDIDILMGAEFRALQTYLESDVCQIAEPVRTEVLKEMQERRAREAQEDKDEQEDIYRSAA